MIPVDLLNYQLIRLLGSGGMGEVYLARNKNIEQFVAVKALHPKYANNPMVRARFKQEAVMLNSLNHPNIVKFLNFVENEYGVFLIMEYIDGCTLEDFITKKNGLIVEEKAYPMFEEILNAFSYAHQHGIIHRDIKPSNIFLDKNGHIKIMDFGIAQIISEVNEKTQGGMSMGTPAYMSPEQVYGQPLNQRSDIYSLGVLFHQMLTGRAPYDSTTMTDQEIKSHVVNETLPRLKSYYPYISDGMQLVVDKATAKKQEDRYATCDEMFKAVKKVLAPEKKSRLPLYVAAASVALCLLIGGGLWDYFRTKTDYYKDYIEVYGVAEGVGKLSAREASHRNSSYRIESSKWKVRRVTLVNSKDKPVRHEDTEHMNSRFTDVYYYYSDNGKLDYKKVYDEYGKPLYKIDFDENLKVAMFKYDDEHGTAKRLQSNTTGLYNVNDSEHSSITRHLLTYDEKGQLTRIEYASGEDNIRVGDAENIYGQAYEYDEKGRITKVSFLGQDGEVRGNKIGLAIKEYKYDEDGNWTQVNYLSATGNSSHDGNNCPVVKLTYDEWGNRETERYYTADEKQLAYRTDVAACGFNYKYTADGFLETRSTVDSKGEVTLCKNGYATICSKYDKNGFLTEVEFKDKNGNKTNVVTDDGDTYANIKFTVDEKGLVLSAANYDLQGLPTETSDGVFKVEYMYDSVGNILKVDYLDKELQPAQYAGFHCSEKYTYNDRYLCQSMYYYDKDGKLTYCKEGFAVCQKTYDKTGNITKYEFLDKDGKTLINRNTGYAVEEVTFDALGNTKEIHHYSSSLKPCMTSLGYYAKEFFYEDSTNFLTEEKFYDTSEKVIKVNKYKYDTNGNQTSFWTVNATGTLQGYVTNVEYDENNRITKLYSTNLSGKRVNNPESSYCEMDIILDDRGNVIEQTYLDVNGNPAYGEHKTHKRIKKYDEHNNCIYEKSLDKDGKPTHGSNTYPEGRATYDARGNMTSLDCLDGYGKPYTCPEGFQRVERQYNESNLVSSECYKDADGNLRKHKSKGFAKATYKYDSKRNLVKETHFGTDGSMTDYVKYSYNDHNFLTEVSWYDSKDKPDASKVFSKLQISYANDGVTPKKKTYYKGGAVLAWQSYNSKTGEWGNLSF